MVDHYELYTFFFIFLETYLESSFVKSKEVRLVLAKEEANKIK